MLLRKKQYETMPMNEARAILQNEPSILLLDVRTSQEYAVGHIRGSINLPLSRIQDIAVLEPNKHRRIFVYCFSGVRSGQACRYFSHNGYNRVCNIGGIAEWDGDIEKGEENIR